MSIRWLELIGIGIVLYVLVGFFWAIAQESFSNGPKTRSASLGDWLALGMIVLFGILAIGHLTEPYHGAPDATFLDSGPQPGR
jgi:hypothetical protein